MEKCPVDFYIAARNSIRTVKRSTVVCASLRDDSLMKTSKLSPLDEVIPVSPLNLTFLYDYVVSSEKLEAALVHTLNRYPEMTGRLDKESKSVRLTNEGALVNYLDESKISIDELKSASFNYDLCCTHFLHDNLMIPHELLMVLNVQELAGGSGMMMNIGLPHSLCDISSYVMLVSDFCSQVRENAYKLDQVVQCERTAYIKPSNDVQNATQIHPEIVHFGSEEEFNSVLMAYVHGILEHPPCTVTLALSSGNLDLLRNDVLSGASPGSSKDPLPSEIDCLISVIHRAYIGTRETDKTMKADENNSDYPCMIFQDVRAVLKPEVPANYFGNANLVAQVDDEKDTSNSFNLAERIAHKVGDIHRDFCQSRIDAISKNSLSQFKAMWDSNSMRFVKWSMFRDLGDKADLGGGSPLKWGWFTHSHDRFCFILPSCASVGDFELNISLPKEHLDEFLQHEVTQKYFREI